MGGSEQKDETQVWLSLTAPYSDVLISDKAGQEFHGKQKLVQLRDLPEGAHLTLAPLGFSWASSGCLLGPS